MNIIDFLKGSQECWECGGTRESPRGYGDSSPCYTCNRTGILKISRWSVLKDLVKKIFKNIAA